MDKNKLKKEAMGIVNQLFDLAEVPVDKRQEINDKADDYMYEQLLIQLVSNQRELLLDFCSKAEDKAGEYKFLIPNPDFVDEYLKGNL